MTVHAIIDHADVASRLDHPDPAQDGAPTVVESALAAGPRTLSDRLRAYYAPDSEECGAAFLDGTETVAPHTVTAADLFAVTMLGVTISRPAARRLLYDTPQAARVGDCLAPSRLPLDVPLTEAGPEVLRAMAALHDAMVAAVDPSPAPAEASHVVASALCARKRPELFPVLDRAFSAALALPGAAAPVPSWLVLRSVLRRPHIREALDAAFGLARAEGHGVPIDVHPLRQLYVLACHIRAESSEAAGRGGVGVRPPS